MIRVMNMPSIISGWLKLLCCLGLITLPGLTRAHDTGLLTLRFQELGDERYQLEYSAPPGSPQGEGLPILPTHCTWETQPDLPVGPVKLNFATDGKPLSADDHIILPWKKNGVLVHAFWRSGETARRFCKLEDEGVVIRIGELRAGAGGLGEAAKRYTLLGFEHILLGLDHLLFVAGLLLLVKGWRRLVATITAFTVAHSISLAISVNGWLRMSQAQVDVLVALSIVFLAVEILHVHKGREGLTTRKPWLVAFLFGLVHGLGFAGALIDLGLPRQDIPVALLFFNVGVELGQLAMIALWFAIIRTTIPGFLRHSPRYAWIPAYALGIIAMCWFFERTLVLFSTGGTI